MTVKNEKVETIYDEIADTYECLYAEEDNADIVKAENNFLSTLLCQDYTNKKILDAGCGTGFLMDILSLPHDKYLGVDISANMLKIAEEKYPKHCFIKSDFMALDVRDKYDFVISIFSVPDYEGSKSVEKAYDLLENNGIYMATFINSDKPFTMACLEKTKNEYDLHKFNYQQLNDCLHRAGFTWYYVISIANIPELTEVKDMEKYLEDSKHRLKEAKYFFVIAQKESI